MCSSSSKATRNMMRIMRHKAHFLIGHVFLPFSFSSSQYTNKAERDKTALFKSIHSAESLHGISSRAHLFPSQEKKNKKNFFVVYANRSAAV